MSVRNSPKDTADRVEAACARALRAGTRSYRSVANILKHGLDRTPSAPETASLPLPLHENVRGADFYGSLKGHPT